MSRVGGRPPIADEPRRLVAIRLDKGVLEKFSTEAERQRVADQTLIDEVLAKHAASPRQGVTNASDHSSVWAVVRSYANAALNVQRESR